jgi:aminoglycoside/choline kinase family phosphotransferase
MGAPDGLWDVREGAGYRRARIGVSTRRAGARRAPDRPLATVREVTVSEATSTEARVRGAVARATGKDAAGAPVRRLAGHASMRSYWRVGAYPASHVVMVMPPNAKPEEVTKGPATGADPFVDVQRYLAGLGVRVPGIVAFEADDPQGGLMVLEDLGDEMLETRLLAGDDRERLYATAVDALARLRAAAEARPGGCVAFTRSFEADLYRWELDHFREWLLEAWKGARLAREERALADAEFDRIARTLAAEPLGFTHRDYQSRNIMVLPSGEQAVIDFQDALLGPRQYDLVALLRDSYVELPAEFVEAMLRRYLAKLAEAGGPRLEYAPFRELFDLLTVQRKLKDAGRFVFIDRVKGNPGFLVSIPASLRYVRDALARRPDLARLREVLARHVPELG